MSQQIEEVLKDTFTGTEIFIEELRIDTKKILTDQDYIIEMEADAERSKIGNDYIESCQADTKRRITRLTTEIIFSDIKRSLLLPTTVSANTLRTKNKDTFQANISIDAKRRLGGELWPPLELHFDHGSGDEI